MLGSVIGFTREESADSLIVGFAGHLRVWTVPAEAVYLISRRGVTALSGQSLEKLAPLLDGTRSLAEVKREAAPDMSAGEVEKVLVRLAEANLIRYRPQRRAGTAGAAGIAPQRDIAADAYWQLAGLDADLAASQISAARLELVTHGDFDPDAISTAFGACGLARFAEEHGDVSLSLVLCDDYLDPELAAVNACHLDSGQPWLLAKPSGPDPWIGPVFRPGAGPCWACLAARLEGNRLPEQLLRRACGSPEPVRPPETSLPAIRAVGLQMAALEAAKWLAGLRYDGQDAVHTLDSLTLRSGRHMVARRPQCPACGDPGLVARRAGTPVAAGSRAKATAGGNGHRALSPEQVLERYGDLIDPVTGIVSELRPDPNCPPFLRCYTSGPNRAVAARSLSALRNSLRAQSGGKGINDTDARVSALGEAVERYCGSRCGDEPTIRASYLDLGTDAVHPNSCLLYDERQYAERGQWNKGCNPLHRVPEPFDERSEIEWSPVWSLIKGERRWLPTAMVYFDLDPSRRSASMWADSNGNAAGSSLEDAILQGFLELVERDAVALWWYNRTSQPQVDVESFADPRIAELVRGYSQMGRRIWVLDITSDLGIPAMAAVSEGNGGFAMGFGAHVDPRVALARACTELGQMIAAGAAVRGPGMRVPDQPYLHPGSGAPVRAEDYRYAKHLDLADDIRRIRGVAEDANLDVLVLDQTRPDIGMPVVKVIVPGMRHFWPRFAPGRLFDVPVRLGRVARCTAYEQLNPVPVCM
jgi:bacteriocin biosynthesis cyclodehydratase domain-containing protein